MTTRLGNPMRDDCAFKLGVFSANADRGLTFTTVPEQWRAQWDDVQLAAKLADEGGFDFFLPIARWRGYGGTTRVREWSFETFTFAAALAAVTSRIALFSTVHVPLVHPIYAAKALATIDHVSHGRSGLNIVCGWNPDEFDMFGVQLEKEAYAQAAEWSEVLIQLYTSDDEFDFDGRFYRLKGAISRPLPLQKPRPVTMNAAFSPPGRDFAARHCDYLFTTFTDLEVGRQHVADIRERGRIAGREIGVYTLAHVVCRATEKAARVYYDRYSLEFTDEKAVEYHMKQKKDFSHSHEDKAFLEYRQRFAAGTGSFPLVGTPAQIVDQMVRIHEIGFAGAALSFVNYVDELPFFCKHVFPLMREAGLRTDHAAARERTP
jgi:alkanesulfonate monooxygenase SsuD/methylene tetrahydromethanopterin reductase-like flavin-dependent oxidoreductase (luciferase family)